MEIGSSLALDELTRGKELVSKLLAGDDSIFSGEVCRSLAEGISSSLDKAISILTGERPPPTKRRHGEVSGRAMGDLGKKRKMMPTSKVRLASAPGMKGPVDDGYRWRKYGKKHILTSKHPRGYYRCTYGKLHGCPAMKQVQQSDDDPLSFDVTYRGTHTCQQKSPPRLLQYQNHGLESGSQEPEVPTFSLCSATSESNNFSILSPCRMSSYEGINLQKEESEIGSSAATPTRNSNSSVLEMEFLLESVNLDQDFPYDTLSYLG